MKLNGLWTALALALASPAGGQPVPTAPADDVERAVLADMAEQMARDEPDLARLDAMLAKLSRPTRLRAAVQSMRALALSSANRDGEAIAAADESVRLDPGNAFILWSAAWTQTFGGSPVVAADLWLQASTLAAEFMRGTDTYLVSALVGRLRDMGETARADKVEARAGELVMTDADPDDRSSGTMARIRVAIAEGDTAKASQLIPDIVDPGDLAKLYLSNSHAPLWPAIRDYAGVDLASAQLRYFEALRRQWWSKRNFDAATKYARALRGVDRPDAILKLFEPLLAPNRLTEYVDGMEFLAPVVASALNRVGRGADAVALTERVERLMPPAMATMALNLSAARISIARDHQERQKTVTLSDAWLKAAAAAGAGINRSATAAVGAMRSCALTYLGRTAEAAEAANPIIAYQRNQYGPAISIFACRNDVAAARSLVLDSLRDPLRRMNVAATFLLSWPGPFDTPDDIAFRQFRDRVKADPAVKAELFKLFRPLDLAALRRLPAGFDPLLEGPTPPPIPGSV